ncbi:hypothetical protein SELMODRAFT_420294 [Selaginella moellendorffii]|uniref:Uncharacterized protein n=1 Tax=Selaginella moellendorffii TaxID=88036 RepID=D8SBJ3_SELML|nr:hypothetical protein SELMODRAFT_420294 [Selaginella moellendorffii]
MNRTTENHSDRALPSVHLIKDRFMGLCRDGNQATLVVNLPHAIAINSGLPCLAVASRIHPGTCKVSLAIVLPRPRGAQSRERQNAAQDLFIWVNLVFQARYNPAYGAAALRLQRGLGALGKRRPRARCRVVDAAPATREVDSGGRTEKATLKPFYGAVVVRSTLGSLASPPPGETQSIMPNVASQIERRKHTTYVNQAWKSSMLASQTDPRDDRDLMTIILECCLQEKVFNTFLLSHDSQILITRKNQRTFVVIFQPSGGTIQFHSLD